MSNIGAMVAELIAAGCAPEVAAQVVAQAFIAGVASTPVRGQSADESVMRRRESDRIRQQNRRDNLRISAESRDNPQTSNDASISKEEKKEETNKEKKEARRGTRLLETWVPNEANISYALGKQVSQSRIETEGRKFRNYWAAKSGQAATKVNWNLTWENWIDNIIEREGVQNGHGANGNRTAPTAGPIQTGADAILAGMGRLASRVAERQLAERQHGLDLAAGDDGERGRADDDPPPYRRVV